MEDNSVVIKLDKVSKSFKIASDRKETLRGYFVNPLSLLNRKNKEFKALEDISFEIKRGEFVGLIGRNGSGKSTLLKILAEIYVPDKGKVSIHGKVIPFLELGVGFNPELTGRENVFLNGVILGMTHKYIAEKYEEIVRFAELEKFMEVPLKNYSSGMMIRLAFSIAIQAKGDVYLLDEVLGVGDLSFQKKSEEKMNELMRSGATILYVSHNLNKVKQIASKAIYLRDSHVEAIGEPEHIISEYERIVSAEDEIRKEKDREANLAAKGVKVEALDGKVEVLVKDRLDLNDIDYVKFRYGNKGAKIEDVKFFNDKGEQTLHLETGQKFSCKVRIKFEKDVQNLALGIMFRKNPQEDFYGVHNIYDADHKFRPFKAGETVTFEVSANLPLKSGAYYASVSLADLFGEDDFAALDVLNNEFDISVFGDKNVWGMVSAIDSSFSIEE